MRHLAAVVAFLFFLPPLLHGQGGVGLNATSVQGTAASPTSCIYDSYADPVITYNGTLYVCSVGGSFVATGGSSLIFGTTTQSTNSTAATAAGQCLVSSGSNPYTWGAGLCSGSGGVNAALQYALPYYSAAGSAATLSGLVAPTTVNGVPWSLISTASGGVATAPTWSLSGVPVDPNGETTCGSGFALNVLNRASSVPFSGGTTCAATSAVHTTAGFGNNFVFDVPNFNSGTFTFTPTTDTCDGAATCTILSNWYGRFTQDASGNWHTVRWPMATLFAAMTTGVVTVTNGTGALSSLALQGTDTSVMTSGTISGAAGTALCIDGNNGATTSGCTAGGGGYATIDNGGSALTQRTVMNIGPGLFAIDNSGSTRTEIRRPMFGDTGYQKYLREEFTYQGEVDNGGCVIGTVTSYCKNNVAGTGSMQPPPAQVAGYFSGLEVTSGATTGNDTMIWGPSNTVQSVFNIFPAASATAYTYDMVVELNTLANDYHAAGLLYSIGQPASTYTSQGGIWCDVTDTASAGNWACHFQNYNGGFQETNITPSPTQTAVGTAIIIRFVVTSSEVDYYFGTPGSLTKVGCGNSGGTGGCTAWTANSLPTQALAPAWEAKTNTSGAAGTSLLGWSFSQ